MLLPLGTDRSLKRPTLVTYLLIAANIFVFTWQLIAENANHRAYDETLAKLWLHGQAFELHTLLTYQFLHADWAHLLGNMLFLYVFGLNVEDRLGRIGFLAFYLVGGAVSGLVHIGTDFAPVIGASGAISGVTGAFLAFFPRTQLRVLLFFFYIGIFWIPAWWLIAFAIAKDMIFQGIGEDNVARMAHIGGYAYGLAICVSLLWWKVLPREPYDLFSIGKQAKRRRDFKELTSRGDSPWAHDPGTSLKRSKKDAGRSALQEASMDERSQIGAMISEGRFTEAGERYEKALNHFPEFTLAREDLIALGNELYREKRYQLASHAYEKLISRFPGDVEAPRTMVMLAIINTRYLNDPVRAKQLIASARERRLDPQYEELLGTLERELG